MRSFFADGPKRLALAAVLASCALAAPARAGFTAEPGFLSTPIDITTPLAFPGGADAVDPDTAVVFDGSALLLVDLKAGAVASTLFTPPSAVFGSFVRVDPSRSFVLFGESSLGDVWRVPLDGSPASVVASVPLNFACAFDGDDAAYLTRGAPDWQSTEIVRLDLRGGGLDLIATVAGPSGPVALDGSGNLLYGQNSPVFPAPPGSGRVLFFSAAQVAAAIGPGSLLESDASIVLTGMNAVTDMLFDEEGDLIVSDSIGATIAEYDALFVFKGLIGAEVQGQGFVTALGFAGNGPQKSSIFAPFQPAGGGTLVAVASDFATASSLQVLRPRRAELQSAPAAPVPPGPLKLVLDHGPPNGRALLFASTGLVEQPWTATYAGVPFQFLLDPALVATLGTFVLDANGQLQLDAANPGLAACIGLQAALVDPFGLPLGSSEPLDLCLQ